MIERKEEYSPRQGLGHRGRGALAPRAQSETTGGTPVPRSGKNRRGGRNPLAKKRRLREEPAFGFPFLNWWRWWELNPRAPGLCTPHLRV